MIPKIIHQIWYQGENNIPDSYPNYRKSWKRLHPNYKYILWDKDSIIKLILDHYPHLYNKFNSYPKMIQKIDMAKYIIMYHYGGIYADVDSECLKSMDNLIKDKEVVLLKYDPIMLEKILAYHVFTGITLQTHIFASQPKHSFWKHVINTLLNEAINKKILETELYYIMRTTGPKLVTKAYHTYPFKKNITLLDKATIDPISWCDYETYNCANTNCGKLFPNAYAIHHYGSKHDTHNWSSNKEKMLGMFYCKYKYKIYIIILLIILIIIYLLYKYMLIQ